MDNNQTTPPKNDLEAILEELYYNTEAACGAPIEEGVKGWWFKHYRAHFYYAIYAKNKKYATDQPDLLKVATKLGTVARRLAGAGKPVTTRDAALASFEVDCPAGLREDWCN